MEKVAPELIAHAIRNSWQRCASLGLSRRLNEPRRIHNDKIKLIIKQNSFLLSIFCQVVKDVMRCLDNETRRACPRDEF